MQTPAAAMHLYWLISTAALADEAENIGKIKTGNLEFCDFTAIAPQAILI